MYNAHHLIHQIDQHKIPILIGFTIAMICQTIFMVDMIRVGARQRVISCSLFCTFFWFAHDTGCVVRFNDWFNTYDFWFMKLFWIGLLSAMLLEFVFFAQAIRYGRAEFLPNVSERTWAAVLALGAIVTIIAWEYLKRIMHDPLYQMSPPLTMLAFPITGAALMMRRRSTIGTTVTIWVAFAVMAIAWWSTTMIFYGPAFRSWTMYASGIATVLGCLALAVVVKRSPAAGAPSELIRADTSAHLEPSTRVAAGTPTR
jgi:hypothetical protein